MPVIRSHDIKEIKTPKDCEIHLCRRWWIGIQEERTDDGALVQTLQTSAIDIGKLVSGYYRFKIQFQMYALILQNCTAHKGCCCLHFAVSRRGINRFQTLKEVTGKALIPPGMPIQASLCGLPCEMGISLALDCHFKMHPGQSEDKQQNPLVLWQTLWQEQNTHMTKLYLPKKIYSNQLK